MRTQLKSVHTLASQIRSKKQEVAKAHALAIKHQRKADKHEKKKATIEREMKKLDEKVWAFGKTSRR